MSTVDGRPFQVDRSNVQVGRSKRPVWTMIVHSGQSDDPKWTVQRRVSTLDRMTKSDVDGVRRGAEPLVSEVTSRSPCLTCENDAVCPNATDVFEVSRAVHCGRSLSTVSPLCTASDLGKQADSQMQTEIPEGVTEGALGASENFPLHARTDFR